jgi:hypothetical protein
MISDDDVNLSKFDHNADDDDLQRELDGPSVSTPYYLMTLVRPQ